MLTREGAEDVVGREMIPWADWVAACVVGTAAPGAAVAAAGGAAGAITFWTEAAEEMTTAAATEACGGSIERAPYSMYFEKSQSIRWTQTVGLSSLLIQQTL